METASTISQLAATDNFTIQQVKNASAQLLHNIIMFKIKDAKSVQIAHRFYIMEFAVFAQLEQFTTEHTIGVCHVRVD